MMIHLWTGKPEQEPEARAGGGDYCVSVWFLDFIGWRPVIIREDQLITTEFAVLHDPIGKLIGK